MSKYGPKQPNNHETQLDTRTCMALAHLYDDPRPNINHFKLNTNWKNKIMNGELNLVNIEEERKMAEDLEKYNVISDVLGAEKDFEENLTKHSESADDQKISDEAKAKAAEIYADMVKPIMKRKHFIGNNWKEYEAAVLDHKITCFVELMDIYYLETKKQIPLSDQSIADIIGVTKEAVRQWTQKALRKTRNDTPKKVFNELHEATIDWFKNRPNDITFYNGAA